MSASPATGNPPRKIAVFRALQLGDLLCAVPALRALRAAEPHAHITLIGLPWAASFAARFNKYIDDFLAFPGFPGLPETQPDLAAIPGFIATAQQRQFDLMLQLHGSGILLNPLTVLLGAQSNAGFYQPGHYCPDPAHFLAWSEAEHEVLRYLRLMEFLGMPAQGSHLEFPLQPSDHHALEDVLQRALPDGHAPHAGSYVVIHPGARLPSRRWLPHRFAEIADRLADSGLRIVLTGSAQEADITQAVLREMHAPALDLTGKTDLGALAALIARARLIVCNDTGVSHIAAAVATPSVVICSGADPARWAPLDRDRHRLLHEQVACRPCMHASCPLEGHPCAEKVTVRMVLQQARDILGAADRSPMQLPARRPESVMHGFNGERKQR